MGSKKQGGGGTREPVEDSSNNVTRWSCSTITISTTHRSSKRQRQHHSATRANNTIQSKDSFRFQGKDNTRLNTLLLQGGNGICSQSEAEWDESCEFYRYRCHDELWETKSDVTFL